MTTRDNKKEVAAQLRAIAEWFDNPNEVETIIVPCPKCDKVLTPGMEALAVLPPTPIPWPEGVKEAINDAIQAGKAEAKATPAPRPPLDPDRGKVVMDALVAHMIVVGTPWDVAGDYFRTKYNAIYDAVIAHHTAKEQR